MSLWIPHSVFWDWEVDFGLPALKYSYTLHVKFGEYKPVIIIDSYMVYFCKSAECVQGQKKICILYYFLYLKDQFWHIYLKQHSMSNCRQNKHTQRHLVEAENVISIIENCLNCHQPPRSTGNNIVVQHKILLYSKALNNNMKQFKNR